MLDIKQQVIATYNQIQLKVVSSYFFYDHSQKLVPAKIFPKRSF